MDAHCNMPRQQCRRTAAVRKADRELVLEAAPMDVHCNMPRQCCRRTASSSWRPRGRALQYAAAVLQADRELVLVAARKVDVHCNMPRQSSRGTASSSWRPCRNIDAHSDMDRELVLEAPRQDETALRYAAGELQADHGEFRQAAAGAIVPRRSSRRTASSSWRPRGRLGPHCDMPWRSSRWTAGPS